jgi:hypothetical protein
MVVRPQILHYSGHGEAVQTEQSQVKASALVLEDNHGTGAAHFVFSDAVATWLKFSDLHAPRLPELVFLSACFSGALS